MLAAFLAPPDGNRSAPVPFSRDGPVHVVAQPLAEPALLDVVGVPVDVPVAGDQLVLQGRCSDVPGTFGVVQQRGFAAPAKGVGVTVNVSMMQQSPFLEVGHDVLVGLLDELAAEGIPAGDVAQQVHRLYEIKTLVPAQGQVFISESRSNVHDACAVLHGHEAGRHDMGREAGFCRNRLKLRGQLRVRSDKPPDLGAVIAGRVQGGIADAYQVCALQGCDYPILLTQVVLQQRGGEDQSMHFTGFVVQLHHRIVGGRVHCQGRVAGQRPGSGGPSQQVGGDASVQDRGRPTVIRWRTGLGLS